MFSRFFIDRPVFALVVSITLLLVGTITGLLLPVEQYPEIAPPTVRVTTSYPGADPATIVDTVTAPLEQEINGVEGMIYMKSTTDASGVVTIDVTFELGTDPDLAAVFTQNRVAIAEPRLPQEVRARGVTARKQSPSLLMVVSLTSPNGSFDYLALSNYVTLNVRDRLSRVDGVGDVFVFGAKNFAMRLWLDPEKLARRDLTTVDVIDALQAQNIQVAAGSIGAPPAETETGFQYTVNADGRLQTVEQFEDIILKVDERRIVRLADVARVELGAEAYSSEARLNGKPAASLGIYQLPGSNAMDVANGVREAMDALAEDFPEGVAYQTTFDFTDFITASVEEVINTLIIAVLLVILITYVFLQDWRATLVPSATIPVSLIATLAVLFLFGFSINLLTLFGLILAIGIVVDDAIVVVENTARNIDEKGMAPREAARAAMDEVSGALVATTLVVLAVFIPAAVLPGITGVMYRQFAVTIAVATCFSTLNALTLSPMLCATLLRPSRATRFPLFTLFNKALDGTRDGYVWLVGKGIRLSLIVILIFAGLSGAAFMGLRITPTGFIPDEDMGYLFVNVQLPDASKLARTEDVLAKVEQMTLETPGVRDVVGVTGFSLLSGTSAPNSAMTVVVLEPWADRSEVQEQLDAIVGSLAMKFAQIPEAIAFPFTPPPVMGLGAAGGFAYELQDRGAAGYDALQAQADALVLAGTQDPQLARLFTGYRANVPQLFVDIDKTKAQTMGVPPAVYTNTLQTALGGTYINDFNLFNRVYRVYAQADAPFRADADDIGQLEVRNLAGQTLPMDTFVEVTETTGPQSINRYNLYPSASITGNPIPGVSSGEAVNIMAGISEQTLAPGFSYEWTGMTYQEQAAGSAAIIAFALGFVVVYLVLAAQYESWSIPLAILMTVPLGVLGAIGGVLSRGLDNNVYTQVGFILLIALVAKNAILIVEFARDLKAKGQSNRDAAMEAAGLRFRPILMTAFSFVFGTFPLVIASGAGASSRVSLGTAVFYGMIVATVLGVVFVPIFFVVIQSITDKLQGQAQPVAVTASTEPPPPESKAEAEPASGVENHEAGSSDSRSSADSDPPSGKQ